MNKERISYLLLQYAGDLATKEEVEELFSIMRSAGGEEALKGVNLGDGEKEDIGPAIPQQDWDRMWSAIRSEAISSSKGRVFSMPRRRIAAAVIFLVMAGAGYLFFNKRKLMAMAPVAGRTHFEQDVSPGGNKATLTLGNGAIITLDSAHNGLIGRQGNTSILKLDEGALAYNVKNKSAGDVLYNAISTPRG